MPLLLPMLFGVVVVPGDRKFPRPRPSVVIPRFSSERLPIDNPGCEEPMLFDGVTGRLVMRLPIDELEVRLPIDEPEERGTVVLPRFGIVKFDPVD